MDITSLAADRPELREACSALQQAGYRLARHLAIVCSDEGKAGVEAVLRELGLEEGNAAAAASGLVQVCERRSAVFAHERSRISAVTYLEICVAHEGHAQGAPVPSGEQTDNAAHAGVGSWPTRHKAALAQAASATERQDIEFRAREHQLDRLVKELFLLDRSSWVPARCRRRSTRGNYTHPLAAMAADQDMAN